MEFNLSKTIYDIDEEKLEDSIISEIEEESAENLKKLNESEVIDEDGIKEFEEIKETQEESHEEAHEEVEEEITETLKPETEIETVNSYEERKETESGGIIEFLEELMRIYRRR